MLRRQNHFSFPSNATYDNQTGLLVAIWGHFPPHLLRYLLSSSQLFRPTLLQWLETGAAASADHRSQHAGTVPEAKMMTMMTDDNYGEDKDDDDDDGEDDNQALLPTAS